MLKTRIITAVTLIPLVLLAIFKLPLAAFLLLTGMVVGVGAWEWSGFMNWRSLRLRSFYVVMVLWLTLGVSAISAYYSLAVGCIAWLFAAYCVWKYQKYKHSPTEKLWVNAMAGILVLTPCWESFAILKARNNGGLLILLLFVFVWAADTSAYFVGKRFGRHQLISNVSPGKTVEGLCGALVTNFILSLGIAWACQLPARYWFFWVVLVMGTTIFAVLGDLFESMMKRLVGLKDSGKLLPGHGGLLDRIDSLTAAAPLFTLGIIWLGVA